MFSQTSVQGNLLALQGIPLIIADLLDNALRCWSTVQQKQELLRVYDKRLGFERIIEYNYAAYEQKDQQAATTEVHQLLAYYAKLYEIQDLQEGLGRLRTLLNYLRDEQNIENRK